MPVIRSKVLLQVGLASAAVDAVNSLEDLKETALKTVCVGEGDNVHPPAKVEQYYECKTCERTGKIGEFDKAREISDNNYVVVPDDEREAMAVPDGLRKNLQVFSYPASVVEAATVASAKPIYLRPTDAASLKPYVVFRTAIKSRPDRATLAIWAPKGAPALHRLEVRGNILVLQPLCWPHQLAAAPEIDEVDLSDAEKGMIPAFMDAIEADFDPAAFKDVRAQALADYVASQSPVEGEAALATAAKGADTSGTNFMDMLQATVAAASKPKAKKAAAPRKKAAAAKKSA